MNRVPMIECYIPDVPRRLTEMNAAANQAITVMQTQLGQAAGGLVYLDENSFYGPDEDQLNKLDLNHFDQVVMAAEAGGAVTGEDFGGLVILDLDFHDLRNLDPERIADCHHIIDRVEETWPSPERAIALAQPCLPDDLSDPNYEFDISLQKKLSIRLYHRPQILCPHLEQRRDEPIAEFCQRITNAGRLAREIMTLALRPGHRFIPIVHPEATLHPADRMQVDQALVNAGAVACFLWYPLEWAPAQEAPALPPAETETAELEEAAETTEE